MSDIQRVSSLLAACRLARQTDTEEFDRCQGLFLLEQPKGCFEDFYILQTLEGYCEGEFREEPQATDRLETALVYCPQYRHICQQWMHQKLHAAPMSKRAPIRERLWHLLTDFSTRSSIPGIPELP